MDMQKTKNKAKSNQIREIILEKFGQKTKTKQTQNKKLSRSRGVNSRS